VPTSLPLPSSRHRCLSLESRDAKVSLDEELAEELAEDARRRKDVVLHGLDLSGM